MSQKGAVKATEQRSARRIEVATQRIGQSFEKNANPRHESRAESVPMIGFKVIPAPKRSTGWAFRGMEIALSMPPSRYLGGLVGVQKKTAPVPVTGGRRSLPYLPTCAAGLVEVDRKRFAPPYDPTAGQSA